MSDESDLKALGEFFKERRQERWENFIQNYVPKLEAKNIEFEIEERNLFLFFFVRWEK